MAAMPPAAPMVRSYASVLTPPSRVPNTMVTTELSLKFHKGFPAAQFTEEEVATLARPFRTALVGKFEGFRPPLIEIRKRMNTIGFKGDFSLGLLDVKNILIRFALEEDYQRCWLKGRWNLGSANMKIIPWTPNWKPETESPIAPVWIELEGLPIHFFEKSALHRITQHIGPLIKLDQATEKQTRPSTAKISIALNLLTTPPDRVWIALGKEEGFWQPITYQHIPSYCTCCSRIGHSKSNCEGERRDYQNKEKLPEPKIKSRQNPMVSNLSIWKPVRDHVQVSDKDQNVVEIVADRVQINSRTKEDQVAIENRATGRIKHKVPAANEQEIPAAIQDDIEEINEEYQTGQPSFPYPEEQNSERIQEHAKNGVSPTHTTVQNQMQAEERCSTPIQLSPIQETNNNGTGVEERSSTVQPSPMLPSQIKETNHNGTGPPCETMTSHMEERSSHMQERSSTCSPLLTSQNQETNSNGTDPPCLKQHNQTAHHGRDHAPNQPLTIQDHPQPNFSSGPAPTFSMQDIQKETDLLKASKDIHHLMGPNEGTGGMVFLRNLEPNKGTQVTENLHQLVGQPGSVDVQNTVELIQQCTTTENQRQKEIELQGTEDQIIETIENMMNKERAEQIQMEALDLAEPRQKITKGYMELRKLDINVTRIDELLQMDSIGTGVASRLRSKDDRSLVDSIAKIQSNQTPQSEDTDEDTEELSYMDERAAQWEVNIGSSRRRALQTRRKANKIAAKGNTLINKGKYHAYEVKRRGGSKI